MVPSGQKLDILCKRGLAMTFIANSTSVHPALNSHWVRRAFETFHNVPFHATADAPNDWQTLRDWNNFHKLGVDSLPVWNGESDQSIYNRKEDNFLFRAWHDAIHLKNNLDFSLLGELRAASIHIKELNALRAPYSVKRAVEADTAGQVLYHEKYKEFVKDQKAFVEACIKNSMVSVLNSGIRY